MTQRISSSVLIILLVAFGIAAAIIIALFSKDLHSNGVTSVAATPSDDVSLVPVHVTEVAAANSPPPVVPKRRRTKKSRTVRSHQDEMEHRSGIQRLDSGSTVVNVESWLSDVISSSEVDHELFDENGLLADDLHLDELYEEEMSLPPPLFRTKRPTKSMLASGTKRSGLYRKLSLDQPTSRLRRSRESRSSSITRSTLSSPSHSFSESPLWLPPYDRNKEPPPLNLPTIEESRSASPLPTLAHVNKFESTPETMPMTMNEESDDTHCHEFDAIYENLEKWDQHVAYSMPVLDAVSVTDEDHV